MTVRHAVLSVDLSSGSYGLQLHACSLVKLSFLFSGEWFSPESSMYFPRNTGVLQDYMFSLEGNRNKMVFMGSWGNIGCFYQ